MKSIVLACCLSAIAVPAAAQVVRVSVATDGTQANASSTTPSISDNGRFVVFVSSATNLVAGDTNGVSDVFLRDRDTDADGIFDESGAVATTRISVASGGVQLDGASTQPSMTPDGRYVVFTSAASNLLPGAPAGTTQVYRFDRQTGTIVRVSETASGEAGNLPSGQPEISANGDVVVFTSTATNLVSTDGHLSLFVRRVSADTTTLAPVPAAAVPSLVAARLFGPLSITEDGSEVAYLLFHRLVGSVQFGLFGGFVSDLDSGTVTHIEPLSSETLTLSISASGDTLVAVNRTELSRTVRTTGATTTIVRPLAMVPAVASPSHRYALASNAVLHDFDFGTSTPLPLGPGDGFPADFNGDDRWLTVIGASSTLVAGDTNDATDIFVFDLPDYLDADDDTMDDRWETIFSVTDPAADPDTDGQTNAQEEDAGTHPNGQVQRFLAEGATGTFFRTTIGLANPNPTLPAGAVLTFDKGDGTRVRRTVSVPAGRSVAVNVGAVPGLAAADVSTTVESDRFLGVERGMAWGSSASDLYGSHAETAAPAPSATWFLAEGSTVLDFDLFYLLQNPQATTTQATVRFLLPSGTTINRNYSLPPGSRTTIHVNQIAGLGETDVSGDITADAPIVVERAMYRSTPSQPFGLGHGAMGVTAPATSWFLAEGATGSFFDLFVLIANPSGADAAVQARYARPDGSVVTQNYTVRANSRFSVYVDAIPSLDGTSVATTLTSTNAVPIVAERAMYWPGGFFDYYEGHASPGTTATALNWIVGGAESGGTNGAQTFVLIANTAASAGEATITLLPDAGFTGTVPAPVTLPLPATSRTTVPITAVDGTFGVLVTSTGASPVPLVVESAIYRTVGGVTWAAGSNALATPVP
jgi:hypothetical protein